ncbi:MAG: hypothetical protein IKS22_07735 [Bacteroidales bacterium]|nr:hypothetical protein [Bacteroidales bacterium]
MRKLLFRDVEIESMKRELWMSENKQSRMTLVTGRAGVGKTLLAISVTDKKTRLYFNLTDRPDKMMLSSFIEEVRLRLDTYVPQTVRTVPSLLSFLFDLSQRRSFTLILDHFDEYISKDMDSCGELRKKWDETRFEGRLNLILITRNPFINRKLFSLYGSPFLNSVDCTIPLRPFTASQMKSIISADGKSLKGDDLLAMCMVTGGLPEMVNHCLEKRLLTKEAILKNFFSEDSPMIRYGEKLLARALGKSREVYLSILMLISTGNLTQADIQAKIGGSNVGGHLLKLETEYGLITKRRPLMAAEDSRNVVRFSITDTFLLFWLRFVEGARTDYDTFRLDSMLSRVKEDFKAFSKETLRRYFTQMLSDQQPTLEVGGDWKSGDPSEIDILALDKEGGRALVIDVEHDSSFFNKKAFLEKVSSLRNGSLKGMQIDARLFTVADM